MSITIELSVNNRPVRATVDDRLLLADFLRDELRLTGTHLGCEHGVCGACTVLLDGHAARSCLMLAAQADGCQVTTIEALADPRGPLHPIQQAFRDCHGLQCGFCTPGMVLAALDLLQDNPDPTEQEIREALSGNICRCTGYAGIVAAVRQAAALTPPAPLSQPWARGETNGSWARRETMRGAKLPSPSIGRGGLGE